MIEKLVMALRNFGHHVRVPTEADPNPPFCWCHPIYAGQRFPSECLGQTQCRFAKEVIAETGIPQTPKAIMLGHLGMGK